MSTKSNYDIRALALEKAVQTHGSHMGDDVAHSKRVLDAAREYESFLCGEEKA